MNEYIKLLSEQAVSMVQNRPNGTCDMNKYNKVFAELIIEQCLYLSKTVPLEGPVHKFTGEYEDGFWDAIELYRKHIEKHFEIK